MAEAAGIKKMKITEVTFVTGNAKKVEEVQAIIGDSLKVVPHKVDRMSSPFSVDPSSHYPLRTCQK